MSLFRVAACLLVGAAALASTACPQLTGCDADLAVHYSPVDTTIRVGQGFRPNVQLFTCGDTKQLTDALLRYSADDTTIVHVDSLSGTMTARAVGHTNASATSAKYGTVARIGITVQ